MLIVTPIEALNLLELLWLLQFPIPYFTSVTERSRNVFADAYVERQSASSVWFQIANVLAPSVIPACLRRTYEISMIEGETSSQHDEQEQHK